VVSKFSDHDLRRTAIEKEESMLEDCLFESRSSRRSRNPASLVLSAMVHGSIAGLLILIPLFQSQVLPQIPVLSPLLPPAAAPRSVELVPPPGARSQPSVGTRKPDALIEPEKIPSHLARIADEPSSSIAGLLPITGEGDGRNNGPLLGFPFGDPNSPGDGRRPAPPPPPPTVASPPRPPTPEPAPVGPIRRGGNVVQSNLLYSPKPEYPRLAIVAHVQGVVVIEAVITREGLIDRSRVRVISGHSLLIPAAVEAVQQWRYRPTLLNGEPVEVLTTMTVNFSMN
jgi:periplasmic protein TonB